MIWQQRSNGHRFKSRWGPAIRSSLAMHWPRTDSSQNMHPSIYSSSRIASLWSLFPYVTIPPRYSTAHLCFSEMVLPNHPSNLYSTTQGPHLRRSVCLNYSQSSSELHSQTWWPGENKLVSAHYVRESQVHSYLEHKAGWKCMRALQVLWSEPVITGTSKDAQICVYWRVEIPFWEPPTMFHKSVPR